MNIGIIGIGFVGSAIQQSINLLNSHHTLTLYDKYKNMGTLKDILNTDMVFLCLPTPYDKQTQTYDKSAIYEICEQLNDQYHGLVILKSTVEPTTTESLARTYTQLELVHNPEFLTARTALQDFHHQTHIIIGKTSTCSNQLVQRLIDFYQTHYKQAQITQCTSTESEMVKINCNSFYAVKIQYFTELYLLCEKLNVNFNTVRDIMLKNKWIHPMHTHVPGHDGQLSYGGDCFPKDTSALLAFMQKHHIPCKVLQGTVQERNDLRE